MNKLGEHTITSENILMIKTMCGDLQVQMAANGMDEYISGVALNQCIQTGSYSNPQLQAVIYKSDDFTSFAIKYYNNTICDEQYMFAEDLPIEMDGTCVGSSYYYTCGTLSDISLNDYSGIMQYGYEDETCSNLLYFMQYGCDTDGVTCISLEPFHAPDSAKILCSDGNGTTIHYSGYSCEGEAISSSQPVDTCVSYTNGLDDQFSQGSIYFSDTLKRQISCFEASKNDDNSNRFTSTEIAVLSVFCIFGLFSVIGCVIYWHHKSKMTDEDEVSIIEANRKV
jgi:hypothetical protein